jgi:hypothetical protein
VHLDLRAMLSDKRNPYRTLPGGGTRPRTLVAGNVYETEPAAHVTRFSSSGQRSFHPPNFSRLSPGVEHVADSFALFR